MLTQLVPKFPEHTGNDQKDYQALTAMLAAWFRKLNEPNVLVLGEPGTWTPVVTALAGTFTTVSASGGYTKIGTTVFYTIDITITTNGTAATGVVVTLPFKPTALALAYGREHVTAGKMLQGIAAAGTASLTILNYDNTYPGANGNRLIVSGFFNV